MQLTTIPTLILSTLTPLISAAALPSSVPSSTTAIPQLQERHWWDKIKHKVGDDASSVYCMDSFGDCAP